MFETSNDDLLPRTSAMPQQATGGFGLVTITVIYFVVDLLTSEHVLCPYFPRREDSLATEPSSKLDTSRCGNSFASRPWWNLTVASEQSKASQSTSNLTSRCEDYLALRLIQNLTVRRQDCITQSRTWYLTS